MRARRSGARPRLALGGDRRVWSSVVLGIGLASAGRALAYAYRIA
jgi:hypothetical protein